MNVHVVGRINDGLAVLLGVAKGDGSAIFAISSQKRIFGDDEGKMNLALNDAGEPSCLEPRNLHPAMAQKDAGQGST